MVKRALAEFDVACHRFMPVQSGYGTPGLDFHLTVLGLAVYIETKKPGGKLSPLQMGTKEALIAAGGIVLVVWDQLSLNTAMEIIRGIRTYDAIYGRVTYLTKTAQQLYEAHLQQVQSGKASHAPVSGDHGASEEIPWRQAVVGAGR